LVVGWVLNVLKFAAKATPENLDDKAKTESGNLLAIVRMRAKLCAESLFK